MHQLVHFLVSNGSGAGRGTRNFLALVWLTTIAADPDMGTAKQLSLREAIKAGCVRHSRTCPPLSRCPENPRINLSFFLRQIITWRRWNAHELGLQRRSFSQFSCEPRILEYGYMYRFRLRKKAVRFDEIMLVILTTMAALKGLTFSD